MDTLADILTGPRESSSAAPHLLSTVVRAAPGTAGEETDLDQTVSTAVLLGAGSRHPDAPRWPSANTSTTPARSPHRRARERSGGSVQPLCRRTTERELLGQLEMMPSGSQMYQSR
jgi:hypothetical protein